MLTSLLLILLNAVFGFFIFLLLARFFMQWARVSFRTQVGAFIIRCTDWMVVPARRILPSIGGWDVPTLICAWIAQAVLVTITLALRGALFGDPLSLTLSILQVSFIQLIQTTLQLLMITVIVDALMSFLSPYHPLRQILGSITGPFLRPIQRIIPTVSGIDLSPLVLLVIIQMLMVVLGYLAT